MLRIWILIFIVGLIFSFCGYWLSSLCKISLSFKLFNSSPFCLLWLGFQIYGIDAASGAAVFALDISAGDHVLDLCAAPGMYQLYYYHLNWCILMPTSM